MNAWNPVIKIGEQIREAIREHHPNNTKKKIQIKYLNYLR